MTHTLKLTYQTPAAEQIFIQVEQGILGASILAPGASSTTETYEEDVI